MNPNPEKSKRAGCCLHRLVSGSVCPITPNFRDKDGSAVLQNGETDEGPSCFLTPSFEVDGYDIYANGDVSRFLDSFLASLGLGKPQLVSIGPVRIWKHRFDHFKVLTGIEWNRDRHTLLSANAPGQAQPGTEPEKGKNL